MNIIQRILRMLEKDLKLFYRDKRTFILVFVAPIVIMLILSNIFNVPDTKQSIKGIEVGLCNLDTEELAIETDVFTVRELEGACEDEARALVRNGQLRAAVIIPEHFFSDIRDGHGSELTSIIDNAKGQIALVSSAAMKALVQDLNEEIGTAFIQAAWVRLSELNQRLAYASEQLAVAQNYSDEVQSQLPQVRERLDAIDLIEVKSNLIAFNQSMTDYENKLDDAITILSGFSTYNGLNLSNASVPVLALNMNLTPLQNYYDASCGTGFFPINGSSPVCPILNSSLEELEAINQHNFLVNRFTEDLFNRTQTTLDVVGRMLNDSAVVEAQLREIRDGMGEYKDNISDVFESIDQLIASEEMVRAEVDRIDALVTNYSEQLDALQAEVEHTRTELDRYTQQDPKNIIRAVTLNEEKVFPGKKVLEFMTPSILALILLFVTMFISSSMIVGERRSGCMARNFLAPISIVTFMLEKTVYLLILAAIEIVCMLSVAMILGISIPFSGALVLALLLVAFSFVSLGMLIGSFSNTENTSLLTSLVIGLPLLFLSGIFFPFEIMPSFMRAIGSYLPLTLSGQLLDQILVYGHGLDTHTALILFAISAVFFVLATLIIKRKPTVD